MKKVYIYCEGPTEESFINEILYPYFLDFGIFVCPIICTTKRTATAKYKGGVSTYGKIRNEIRSLCREHGNAFVTTMFDYYGMPDDTPGITEQGTNIFDRIEKIESAITHDIGMPNFRSHLMLHEFEALLFSNPSSFEKITGLGVVGELIKIRDGFETPEHINNSPSTSPSKRIFKLLPRFAKIRDGLTVAKDIGIGRLISQCPHFSRWLESIKEVVGRGV